MIKEIEIRDIKAISQLVKENFNYDFSDYAYSSLKRRLERILELFSIPSCDVLISKLKTDKDFVEIFVKEITVNTTEMFRDPSMWRVLRDEIIPSIKSVGNIRIWHAACSSGEEVYSMAILLKEMGLLSKALISATDINNEVLSVARKGEYPVRNMELNASNYDRFQGVKKLSDYYEVKNNKAILNPQLLENVRFMRHDLVLNEPFSKFDIILCRNVLIYFNMTLQDQVIRKFEHSMYKGGYLIIGSKETIAFVSASKNYSTVSATERIYQKTTD